MQELKAYYVYDRENEYGDFIQAESANKARYMAYFYPDVDWVDIKARRIPSLDGVTNPTQRQIAEAGYSVNCFMCYAEYIDDPVFNDDGYAFCDEVCRSKYRAKMARAKAA